MPCRIQQKRNVQGKAESLWLLFKTAEYFFPTNLFSRFHWLLKSSSEFNWLIEIGGWIVQSLYLRKFKMEPFCGNRKTPSKLAQGCTSKKLPPKEDSGVIKATEKIKAIYGCTVKSQGLRTLKHETCINSLVWAATLYITVTVQLPKIFSCLMYIAVTLYIMVNLPFLKGDTGLTVYSEQTQTQLYHL